MFCCCIARACGDDRNAYLNASMKEKVHCIEGPVFGEEAGKISHQLYSDPYTLVKISFIGRLSIRHHCMTLFWSEKFSTFDENIDAESVQTNTIKVLKAAIMLCMSDNTQVGF